MVWMRERKEERRKKKKRRHEHKQETVNKFAVNHE